MTPAPHPLRCETCKKGYCFNRAVPEHRAFTEMRGCASHSASSDVLEEQHCCLYPCEYVKGLNNTIKYFRQQTKVREP